MPADGLAHAIVLPKRGEHPAPQPFGVDVEHFAQMLEGEGALPVAALDPGQVTAQSPGAPAASGDQTTQAVLEHREGELQLTRDRLPGEPHGNTAAARFVRRLAAAAAQLGHANGPSRPHHLSHTLHKECTDGRAAGYRACDSARRIGASAAESAAPATRGRAWNTLRCSSSSV